MLRVLVWLRLRGFTGIRCDASRESPDVLLLHWGVFHHRLADARAEYQAFQERIAGQPIGAVYSGCGGFSRGIKAGQGSAAPEISFHATHHVVRGGADRSNVARKIDAI